MVFTFNLRSQILKTECLNAKKILYRKVEWQIELKSQWTNPYAASEIALDMQITSPSGKKLTANGGNFFRTWMIYWNLPVDWKTVSNNRRYKNTTSPYNESGMKRMDQLVQLCDSLGIHMMLALESHVGYMDDGWKISNYNVANGGSAKTPVEFFTLPEARQQYKNKLRLMVARFGYSPSIGAWEFFNEIDNAMYAGKPENRIPDAVISAWHEEMSSYLKSIDP